MLMKKIISLFLLFCLTTSLSIAQNKITGKVVSKDNSPLPGVTIIEEGTANGTISDINGTYSLTLTGEGSNLIFTFIGMKKQKVPIDEKTVLNVILEEGILEIDEVVAVGYGTQIRSKISSSLTSVKVDEVLENRPLVSVQQGLRGVDAGLIISQANGRPGTFPGMTIRGSGNPVVLVDGFESSIANVDPNQIEKITLLKDASATAVYGLRGADGVILITTKSGKKNTAVRVNYNMNYSVQAYTMVPTIPNTVDYMQLRNKAYINESIYINGQDPATVDNYHDFSEDVVNRAKAGEFNNTNWPDLVYGENATFLTQNFDISGGTDKTVYSLAAGYVNQKGINISDEDGYKRYNLRLKSETDINKWLSIGANTSITHRDLITVPVDAQKGMRPVPLYPVYDPITGLPAVGDGGTSLNPIVTSTSGSLTNSLRDVIESQLYAKVKLFKGLIFEENVNIQINSVTTKAWTDATDIASLEFDGQLGEYSSNPNITAKSMDRKLKHSSSRNRSITTQSLLNYSWSDKDIHFVKVMVGWLTEDYFSEGFTTERKDFLNSSVHSLNMGSVEEGLTNSSSAAESSRLSAIGRINYDYKGRYLAEFSFRNDISSQFAKGHRNGFFPSFSVAWNIAEESFMNIGLIDLLKLRTSWGKVGRDNVAPLSYIQQVNQNYGYPWITGMEPGLVVANYATPGITWETHDKMDVGIDVILFDGKLGMTADYFINKKYDILAASTVSKEFGLPAPNVNRRSNKYQGWELMIFHKNKINNWGYSITVNASNVRSEWLSLGGDLPTYGNTLVKEGSPVGSSYGYISDGLIMNQQESDDYINNYTFNGPLTSVQYVGAPRLVDISGPDGVPDGQIDSEYDRTTFGNDKGTYNIGMQLGVSYKNFALTAFADGIFNRNVYATGGLSEHPFASGIGNAFSVHKECFDPDNPDRHAPYPLLRSGLLQYDRSSYWFRTASYVRIVNINFSYQFDNSLLEKTRVIKNASLFVSVENPFLIWDNFYATDYGWDPELGMGNVDYPLPRTFSIGANITF